MVAAMADIAAATAHAAIEMASPGLLVIKYSNATTWEAPKKTELIGLDASWSLRRSGCGHSSEALSIAACRRFASLASTVRPITVNSTAMNKAVSTQPAVHGLLASSPC